MPFLRRSSKRQAAEKARLFLSQMVSEDSEPDAEPAENEEPVVPEEEDRAGYVISDAMTENDETSKPEEMVATETATEAEKTTEITTDNSPAEKSTHEDPAEKETGPVEKDAEQEGSLLEENVAGENVEMSTLVPPAVKKKRGRPKKIKKTIVQLPPPKDGSKKGTKKISKKNAAVTTTEAVPGVSDGQEEERKGPELDKPSADTEGQKAVRQTLESRLPDDEDSSSDEAPLSKLGEKLKNSKEDLSVKAADDSAQGINTPTFDIMNARTVTQSPSPDQSNKLGGPVKMPEPVKISGQTEMPELVKESGPIKTSETTNPSDTIQKSEIVKPPDPIKTSETQSFSTPPIIKKETDISPMSSAQVRVKSEIDPDDTEFMKSLQSQPANKDRNQHNFPQYSQKPFTSNPGKSGEHVSSTFLGKTSGFPTDFNQQTFPKVPKFGNPKAGLSYKETMSGSNVSQSQQMFQKEAANINYRTPQPRRQSEPDVRFTSQAPRPLSQNKSFSPRTSVYSPRVSRIPAQSQNPVPTDYGSPTGQGQSNIGLQMSNQLNINNRMQNQPSGNAQMHNQPSRYTQMQSPAQRNPQMSSQLNRRQQMSSEANWNQASRASNPSNYSSLQPSVRHNTPPRSPFSRARIENQSLAANSVYSARFSGITSQNRSPQSSSPRNPQVPGRMTSPQSPSAYSHTLPVPRHSAYSPRNTPPVLTSSREARPVLPSNRDPPVLTSNRGALRGPLPTHPSSTSTKIRSQSAEQMSTVSYRQSATTPNSPSIHSSLIRRGERGELSANVTSSSFSRSTAQIHASQSFSASPKAGPPSASSSQAAPNPTLAAKSLTRPDMSTTALVEKLGDVRKSSSQGSAETSEPQKDVKDIYAHIRMEMSTFRMAVAGHVRSEVNDDASALVKVLALYRSLSNQPKEKTLFSQQEIGVLADLHTDVFPSPTAFLECVIKQMVVCFSTYVQTWSDHMNLLWGDIELSKEGDKEYLLFTGKFSKAGSFQMSAPTMQQRAYQRLDAPGRCPVTIYKEYMRLRPAEANAHKMPFYLTPNRDFNAAFQTRGLEDKSFSLLAALVKGKAKKVLNAKEVVEIRD